MMIDDYYDDDDDDGDDDCYCYYYIITIMMTGMIFQWLDFSKPPKMFLEMLIHSVKILYGLVKIDSNHWLMAGLLGWYWMILMGTWDRQWPQLRPIPWLFPGKSHGSLH